MKTKQFIEKHKEIYLDYIRARCKLVSEYIRANYTEEEIDSYGEELFDLTITTLEDKLAEMKKS